MPALRSFQPLFAGCLFLLPACTPPVPPLEGSWASQSETDFSYWPSGGFAKRYGPTSVVGKSRLEITPDSFLHFDTRGVRERRAGAYAYQRQGTTIVIPASHQKLQIKALTRDTLTLLYQRVPAAGSPYGHVDSEFTFTR